MIKFLLTILKIFLIVVAVLVLFNTVSNGQTYISPIGEKQYNKIAMGELFYEGQIQLNNGTWHRGWIARFPDTNKIRFRAEDDSTHVFTLTDKYVKSFSYNLKDSFPRFIFKDMAINSRRSETKAIELLIVGDINLYVYKTVEIITYTNALLQKKYEYQMLIDFYLEKNGELYDVDDFEKDLRYLVKDKKDFFDYYRNTKRERRDREYRHYINAVIKYNETEFNSKDQGI